jgi:hypothetical protein
MGSTTRLLPDNSSSSQSKFKVSAEAPRATLVVYPLRLGRTGWLKNKNGIHHHVNLPVFAFLLFKKLKFSALYV